MSLENRVFAIVGVWKNYDELEDNLTLDELVATHKALSKYDHEHYRAMFAAQGVEIPDPDSEDKSEKTIDDVYRKAVYGSKFGDWDPDRDYALEEISDLVGIGIETE